jgi:hypothetical protein
MAMNPVGAFKSHQAPCGKMVDGTRYEDRDEEVKVTQQQRYDCGCVVTLHEYHDGSVSRTVVHHNGKVLEDELLDAE